MHEAQTISDALDAIGRKSIMARLGIGKSCLSGWIARGAIPAQWYLLLSEIGETQGVEIPARLFSMSASQPRPHLAAPQPHGDAD